MTDAAESYAYHAEGRTAGRPLVFVFHGTGGAEAQFVPLARELIARRRHRGAAGRRQRARGAALLPPAGEGRYDMADLERRTAAMAGFIEAHVALAQPSRVIGLGYSNGANILASVIFRRPALFDAAVLMHPLIPWTPEPAPVRTRVLITAGERDPICPPQATRALEAWFRDQGASVEVHWQPGGHEVDRSEITAIAGFLR